MFRNERISRMTGDDTVSLPTTHDFRLEEGAVAALFIQGVLEESKIATNVTNAYLSLAQVRVTQDSDAADALLDAAKEALNKGRSSLTEERERLGDRTADALSLARSSLMEAIDIGAGDSKLFEEALLNAAQFFKESRDGVLESMAKLRSQYRAA